MLIRTLRRSVFALVIFSTLAVVFVIVGIANAVVLLGGGGSTGVADAPHAQVALVLGAQVNPDGSLSTMLADRVAVGARLYREGKVDKVLASGDHGTRQYDEVDAMKRALIAAGVPARDVFTDHAGFDTWNSVVRARKVFQVTSALIVTQNFHLPRAVWLARRAGLEAHGVSADIQGYGHALRFSQVRELFARVKAVEQVVTGANPKFLGPKIPITGDGRSSAG